MKLATIATVILGSSLLTWGAASAPFGSVPIQKPTTEVSAPSTGGPSAPTQAAIGAGAAPLETQEAPSVWDSPQPAFYSSPVPAATLPQSNLPATVAPAGSPDGKKWVQDSRGMRYQVSSNATLPPGWVEIPAPAQAPQPQVQTLPAAPLPAPAAAPVFQQPQTYSGAQPPVNVPRQQVQPQSPQYFSPNPNTTPYPLNTGQAGSGLPPGKKRMRHASGYTVIVSQDAIPGPDFTEIESNPTPAGPQPLAAPPGYAAPQQLPMQQPQTYSGYTQPAPAPPAYPQPAPQQPAYYQQPQTYNTPPQLPHIPPTWQQQLPYQPPQPQYQPPMPGQAPYLQPQMQQQPLPVVRKTPVGKKWVADQSGLRYLVDQSTVVMPPMREVTEEELNQPMYIGPQPGQQQPQGSAIGRFFQGLTNR